MAICAHILLRAQQVTCHSVHVRAGARLQRIIPGARRVVLPESGHAPLLEKPISLLDLLIRTEVVSAEHLDRFANGRAQQDCSSGMNRSPNAEDQTGGTPPEPLDRMSARNTFSETLSARSTASTRDVSQATSSTTQTHGADVSLQTPARSGEIQLPLQVQLRVSPLYMSETLP